MTPQSIVMQRYKKRMIWQIFWLFSFFRRFFCIPQKKQAAFDGRLFPLLIHKTK